MLRLSKYPVASFRIPIYLQKRSVYLSAMNEIIIRFHEHGLTHYLDRSIEVPQLFKEANLAAMSKNPKALWKETAVQVPLSMERHMNGQFWILLAGCAAGMLAFIAEVIIGRRKQH